MIMANIEYLVDYRSFVHTALFFDIGKVVGQDDDIFSDGEFKSDIGIGLGFSRSFRIEFAKALDDSDSDIHIGGYDDECGGPDEVPACLFFVDVDVAASGDGKSWGTAFKTVQEGIDADDDLTERIPRDLNWNERVSGGSVDMGAYEYQGE